MHLTNSAFPLLEVCGLTKWRHGMQHNDIQNNDIQHNKICDTQHTTLNNNIILSVVMLKFIHARVTKRLIMLSDVVLTK
jgi:hypothetical protein